MFTVDTNEYVKMRWEMRNCMNKNINYRQISKILRKRYILAVIAIIIIVSLRQLVIDYYVDHSKGMTGIMNISGRQRMLSQKISKDALQIYYNTTNKDKLAYYIEDMEESVDEWRQVQIDLQTGSSDKGIDISANNEKITSIYSEIETNHQAMMAAANDIIILVKGGTYNQVMLNESISIIQYNEQAYLAGMEEIVDLYDAHFAADMSGLNRTEIMLYFFIILTIFVVVVLIFVPAEKHLGRTFKDISDNWDNMISILKAIHGPLFLIDANNYEIIVSNEDGENLVYEYRYDPEDEPNNNLALILEKMSLEGVAVMNQIIEREKISEYEITAGVGEKAKNFVITSAKGRFQHREVIMVVFSDITSRKKSEAAMRRQAFRDELTGLYNRHFMDMVVSEELQRSKRYNFPVSILILDLDHFKNVNDTFGHPAGDAVLKKVAEIVSSVIRGSDYLFRLGGEEILLFMPHTNLKQALVVGEKIRKEVERHIFEGVGRVTESSGIAELEKDEDFSRLYSRADSALYLAKKSGRNRVVADREKEGLPLPTLLINWKEEWNSGNAVIDEQHKQLVDIANELINMSFKTVGKQQILFEIDLLIEHVGNHFETEEKILERVGYQDLKKHSMEHKGLLEKTKGIKKKYLEGEAKISALFTFVVDEIIIAHMLDTDVKYFDLFRENNNNQQL